MVYGIGIDITQIDRFNSFEKRSSKALGQVFTPNELKYLGDNDPKEFYASRFAAKEAFYKALSQSLVAQGFTDQKFSFQFARQNIEVLKGTWELPIIKVDWSAFEDKIGKLLPKMNVKLSISHEKAHAIAMVIITD